jgi:hypothetical protein
MKKIASNVSKQIRDEALGAVAKRGVIQFRLDPNNIKLLYKLAGQNRKPVGRMVREWVLEKLTQKEFPKKNQDTNSIMRVMESLTDSYETLTSRVSKLEAKQNKRKK